MTIAYSLLKLPVSPPSSSLSADELFSCLVEQKAFKYSERGLPGGSVVKTLPFTVGGTGSILGLGAKIPHD